MLPWLRQLGLSLLAAIDHTCFLFTVYPKGVRNIYSSFSLDVDTHKSGYKKITNASFLNTLDIMYLLQVNNSLRNTRSEVLRRVMPLLKGPAAPMMLFVPLLP